MVIIQLNTDQLTSLIQNAVHKALSQQPLERKQLSPEDKLLTVEQAASFLTLAIPTIYSLVQRREIPVSKRGKRLYFSEQELTAWVKSGRKKTQAEIVDEATEYITKQKRRG